MGSAELLALAVPCITTSAISLVSSESASARRMRTSLSSGSLLCNRMPVRPSAGVMLSLYVSVGLQLFDFRNREAVDDVERAAQQSGLGGGTVGNDVDADLVDLDLFRTRIAIARLGARDIIVEADQVDILAALPLTELERTGGDRFTPLAIGREGILGAGWRSGRSRAWRAYRAGALSADPA